MKKAGLVFLMTVGWYGMQLHAQDYKTALGIRISSQQAKVNHSVTLKHFFSQDVAGEVLVSFSDPGAIGILLEKHRPIGSQSLTWVSGAGAYLGFSENYRWGMQGILGLDLNFPGFPINFSVDWKPELNISKVFSFEPAAVGVSARFIFR